MIIHDNNQYLADTACVQVSGQYGILIHCGFGDFKTQTQAGDVRFERLTQKATPALLALGWSGRVHRVSGPGLGWLLEQLDGQVTP